MQGDMHRKNDTTDSSQMRAVSLKDNDRQDLRVCDVEELI